MKKICFDIDGVIFEEAPTFEKILAKPIPGAINKINELFQSNFIILFTARSWDMYRLTEKQLKEHGVKYHVLVCGKPVYDILIDDRAVSFDNWQNNI